MTQVKHQVYYSLVKMMVYACLVFNISKGLFVGFLHENLVSDTFYLFLIMFLRSSMTSSVWTVGLKWTILVSIPIESVMYGGGARAFMIAAISAVKFLLNYGFVLYWNPVLTKMDTLPNRLIEIVISSILLSIFAPLTFQTLLVQIVLSIHSYWVQSSVVRDVCESGVMNDVKAVIADIPLDGSPARPPVEVWFLAYHAATKKINVFTQDLVDTYLVPSSPWQLRRLIVRSIGIDPTRSQVRSLLVLASQSSAQSSQKQPNILTSGPLALVSEEPNEKLVVNEAIASLKRLYTSLGEKRFMSAFERSADGKLALDIISHGYK